MANITIERRIEAPPHEVFAALTDHRAYADFTLLRKSELEKEGTPAPNGVGAIRRLSLVGPPMVEEVTEYEVGKRFSYKLLSGLPVKNHHGTVTLKEDGMTATEMTYSVDFEPALGPLGFAVPPFIKKGVSDLIKGVAREAVRRSAVSSAA